MDFKPDYEQLSGSIFNNDHHWFVQPKNYLILVSPNNNNQII